MLVGLGITTEVFLASNTQTSVREVREHVTASIGLNTLVSLVLALRASVTDKLRADTQRIFTFETRLSILKLTISLWSLNTAVTLQGLGLGAETVASPVTAEMFSSSHTVTPGLREEVTALAGLNTLVTVVTTLGEAITDQVSDQRLFFVELTPPLI